MFYNWWYGTIGTLKNIREPFENLEKVKKSKFSWMKFEFSITKRLEIVIKMKFFQFTKLVIQILKINWLKEFVAIRQQWHRSEQTRILLRLNSLPETIKRAGNRLIQKNGMDFISTIKLILFENFPSDSRMQNNHFYLK